MDWPKTWFMLFGSAQIILGALAILVWKMNRNAANHGGHDLHRALAVGIVLIAFGAGTLWRERISVTLSSLGFALIAFAALYADRRIPFFSFALLFEVTCAAVLLLPAIVSFRFRRSTRWLV
jgi:hypothetical protein